LAVDDTEFREFFASEFSRLCWLGFLLTGSGAEGEELAQEALVHIWWRWRLGRRPDDPASYARRVLVNRRRSLLRRAALEARSLGRAHPTDIVPPADSERSLVLWEAVRSLPPRQRAVLVLRYKEDLTEAEVARLLGVPVGTVKSASHRALARLRERLGTYDLDPAARSGEERR
jgi:RNA polymerase sigma-70 factor (sigma-E family)